jgi:hypothetical protein
VRAVPGELLPALLTLLQQADAGDPQPQEKAAGAGGIVLPADVIGRGGLEGAAVSERAAGVRVGTAPRIASDIARLGRGRGADGGRPAPVPRRRTGRVAGLDHPSGRLPPAPPPSTHDPTLGVPFPPPSSSPADALGTADRQRIPGRFGSE